MKIVLKPMKFRADDLLMHLRKQRIKREFLQAYCVDKGISIINEDGYKFAEDMFRANNTDRTDAALFLGAFDFSKSTHGSDFWREHFNNWVKKIDKLHRELEAKGEKMIITYPDSQNLSERVGFWQHCKLICDLEGIERFGVIAYLVDKHWYLSEPTYLEIGAEIPDTTEDINAEWKNYGIKSIEP